MPIGIKMNLQGLIDYLVILVHCHLLPLILGDSLRYLLNKPLLV